MHRWGLVAFFAGLIGLAGWAFWHAQEQAADRPRAVSSGGIAGGTPVPPAPPQDRPSGALPPARAPAIAAEALSVQPGGILRIETTADPRAAVALVANGVVVAEGEADAQGRATLGPTAPLSPGTTEFRLRATLADGRTALSPETLAVAVPRSTAEPFTVTLRPGTGPPRELVRVDPTPLVLPDFGDAVVGEDGRVTVGGSADPGAVLALLANGTEVARAVAGADGRFTLGPTPPLPGGDSRLELRSTHPDGRTGQAPDVLALRQPLAPGGAFSATREAPGREPRVLAFREATPAEPPRLDRADILPDGTGRVSGSAVPGARVALLVDGAPLAEADAAADGGWTLAAPAQAAGEHRYLARVTLADGRSAESRESVLVRIAASPEEPFTAELQAPGAEPRLLARVDPVWAPPASPRFEVVRVEPDGSFLLAGSGTPGARLVLRRGDGVLAGTQAGESGDWSIVPAAPLPAGESVLQLLASRADGRAETAGSERLLVRFPAVAGEPFTVAVIGEDGVRRDLGGGVARQRDGVAAPEPPVPEPPTARPPVEQPQAAQPQAEQPREAQPRAMEPPTAPPSATPVGPAGGEATAAVRSDPLPDIAAAMPVPDLDLPPPPNADTMEVQRVAPGPSREAPREEVRARPDAEQPRPFVAPATDFQAAMPVPDLGLPPPPSASLLQDAAPPAPPAAATALPGPDTAGSGNGAPGPPPPGGQGRPERPPAPPPAAAPPVVTAPAPPPASSPAPASASPPPPQAAPPAVRAELPPRLDRRRPLPDRYIK